MKTETASLATTNMHVCKNCKRELSLESFYVNKTTQCPDRYCKECRKSLSRRQYSSGKRLRPIAGAEPSYPIITQVEDRQQRIQLIRNALQTVQQSMERKRLKVQAEAELLEDASLL